MRELIKKWRDEAEEHSKTAFKLLDQGNDEHKYFSGICYGLRIAANALEKRRRT